MALSLDLCPIICQGVAIESLPLTPQEGFVLSRVNGLTAVREIIAATGLPAEMVEASLQKLEGLGAIEWQKVETAVPRSRSAARPQATPSTEPQPESLSKVLERIKLLHRQLDRLDHYRLLNIPRSADAAKVKEAFINLSRELHPDRFHKMNLGPRKEIVEAVFARISEAYEVLRDVGRRRSYDQSLLPESVRRQREEEGEKRPQVSMTADASRILELADQAYHSGSYASALTSLKLASAMRPSDKEIQKKIAHVSMVRQLYDGLKVYEQKKAEKDLLADSRIEAAYQTLERAAGELPAHEELLSLAIQLLLAVGLAPDAARLIAEKLFRVSSKALHIYYLGKVLEQERRIDDAVRNYERAVAADPDCIPAQDALRALKRKR